MRDNIYTKYGLRFYMDDLTIHVYDSHTKDGQGMFTLEKSVDFGDGQYYLYRWFDQDQFPENFDTVKDINGGVYRLRVVGIDEL